MLNYLIVFCALLSVCYSDKNEIQNTGRHHHHYYYDERLIYHGLQFLVFLTIKFKLILFFSAVFTVFCVVGKLNALVKYIAIKEKHAHHHHDPVYYQAPSYGYGSHGKKRSYINEEEGFYENFDIFARMIRQLNITELAFDSMNMTTEDCRRRFVCEADYNAKHSTILKAGYDMLSDESYSKYKTKKPINIIEQCSDLYPDCEDYRKNTQ